MGNQCLGYHFIKKFQSNTADCDQNISRHTEKHDIIERSRMRGKTTSVYMPRCIGLVIEITLHTRRICHFGTLQECPLNPFAGSFSVRVNSNKANERLRRVEVLRVLTDARWSIELGLPI